MKMRIWFQSARPKTGSWPRKWGVALIAAAIGCPGLAAGEEPSPDSLRLVITPKFTLPQVSQPVAGSREVLLAPAWESADGVRLVFQNQWEALHLDWETLKSRATAASSQLAQLQPELIRDARGVLECAILRSESADDITGVVLTPEFLKRFTPLFGSKFLVAVPDRSTLFLFPKLASRYPDYASRVLSVYRESAHPVSREVYEISADGLRAVGAYEE